MKLDRNTGRSVLFDAFDAGVVDAEFAAVNEAGAGPVEPEVAEALGLERGDRAEFVVGPRGIIGLVEE